MVKKTAEAVSKQPKNVVISDKGKKVSIDKIKPEK